MFSVETGARTIFSIKLTQGQAGDITRYSRVQADGEVVLPPRCRFQVMSVLHQGDELALIQLTEILSQEWMINLQIGACMAQTQASSKQRACPSIGHPCLPVSFHVHDYTQKHKKEHINV